MILDGLGADFQKFGDLLGVLALGDELKNLALPPGQLFQRTFGIGGGGRRMVFEQSRGIGVRQMNVLLNFTLQRRLRLFRARLRLLGADFGLFRSDFSLFRPRLRLLRPGFRLFGARLGQFSPGLGLLRARLSLLCAGFRLLKPRLLARYTRWGNYFFSHPP